MNGRRARLRRRAQLERARSSVPPPITLAQAIKAMTGVGGDDEVCPCPICSGQDDLPAVTLRAIVP